MIVPPLAYPSHRLNPLFQDYYYNPKGDYNATLVAVYESAIQLQIPYKWILLDSCGF